MGVDSVRLEGVTHAPALPEVSLVVPVYNEAGNPVRCDAFRTMLEGNLSMLGRDFGSRYEVLVVNDGSTDQTPEVAAEFPVTVIPSGRPGENLGKGGAVREGMARAQGALRVYTDADGSYSPATIQTLLQEVSGQGTDIAVAERLLSGHGSHLRRAGHVCLEKVLDGIIPTDVPDTQAGAKAFTANSAELWQLVSTNGYAADRHMLALAKVFGMNVVSVPAEVTPVPGSHIRPVRDSFRMVGDAFRIHREVSTTAQWHRYIHQPAIV